MYGLLVLDVAVAVCCLSMLLNVEVCCRCCCRCCCVLCVVVVRCVLLFVVLDGLCLLFVYSGVLHGVGCCSLFDGCWLMVLVCCMLLADACCCCGLLLSVCYVLLYVGDAYCYMCLHDVAVCAVFALLLRVAYCCCWCLLLGGGFVCVVSVCWLLCCYACCLLLLWPRCCCLLVWLVFVVVGWGCLLRVGVCFVGVCCC